MRVISKKNRRKYEVLNLARSFERGLDSVWTLKREIDGAIVWVRGEVFHSSFKRVIRIK